MSIGPYHLGESLQMKGKKRDRRSAPTVTSTVAALAFGQLRSRAIVSINSVIGKERVFIESPFGEVFGAILFSLYFYREQTAKFPDNLP